MISSILPLAEPAAQAAETWVTARLTNGLGNRLFQLAAAKKLSDQWATPLVFARPYCTPSEHGEYETIFKMFPSIPSIWKAEPLLAIDQDRCFEFCPLPSVAPASRVLLRGMWQAAEYVDDSFKPSWTAIENQEELQMKWNLASTEQQQKTAFLHVRLGDYRVLPHHQVNLLSYYQKAMKSFPSDIRFLVFSDEPQIAASLPVFHERCVFVDEPDELRSLWLMSLCTGGAITANSTFSWWGAFFGRQHANTITDYRACMPARWLVTSNEPTDTIYPSWATRINTD
jgi:hypothetical protein